MGLSAASISAIAGVAGAGSSALGALTGGQAAKLQALGGEFSAESAGEAAAYNAQVAKNNAIIAGYNATEAEEAGQQQALATSLQGAAQGGQIKASQAANNIDVNSGSAAKVQQSQREISQLSTETVLNNAELTAYGYRSQQTGFTEQAGLYGMEASQAPVAAALAEAGGEAAETGAEYGAVGSLLSNASSVGFKWGALTSPGASTAPSQSPLGTDATYSNYGFNVT